MFALVLLAVQLAVLLLRVDACAAEGRCICTRNARVSHVGLSGATNITVTVWKLCAKKRPLAAFIVTGALVLSSDYRGLARALAYRGFAVYVGEYTSRPPNPMLAIILEQVRKEVRGRWKCPRYGNLNAVSMFRTLIKFARREADVSKALLVGHSFGATVTTYEVFRLCSGATNNTQLAFLCDGATNAEKRVFGPAVVTLFEGLPKGKFGNLEGTLMINMLTRYASSQTLQNATDVLSRRAIDVMFDDNVNHFGLNDYASEFNHVKTKCAALMGAGSDFRTSPRVQSEVVRSMADIMTLAYYAYVGAGDPAIERIAIQIQNMSYVKDVMFNG